MRARKYVGKSTDVITKTSRDFTPEYAVAAALGRRSAASRPRSLDRCAEDGGRVEIDLAAHETAGDPRTAAGLDDAVETFASRVGNRDEHRVRREAAEHPPDLVQARDHGHALDPAAPERRVVV